MRYLITSNVGLGNMILKTPMFKAIQALDPGAEIDVMANNRAGAVDVIRGLPELRNAYEFQTAESPRRRKEFARLIRDNKYDVALIPMDGGPGWLRLILWRSRIPKKVQLCAVPGNRLWERAQLVLLHRRIEFVPWLVGRHEIDMNLDLVQALIKKPLHRNYQTSVCYQPDKEVVARFGLPSRYVCLQVGAAEGLHTPKRWPVENFSRLIRALGERYPDIGLVTVGTPREYEMFVAPLMEDHPQLINTAGRTDIGQLCNVLQGAEAVVTHDSGIMHIANALDSRLIALYGPTDFTRTRPLGENAVVLRQDLPCAPCMFGSGGPSESEIYESCPQLECMAEISVNDVLDALQKALKN
ncbi:MAG: glycosyltransferase family 9 protein [Proteobacteria bacterium]|nr:glycosyltransferase family 9 protein [Pseudomonadota bacterium]MBU4384646.1 glycosyltransferase family 9 protein [Pseudomonadota bacterium]MCG2766206.1 glycosyltransferase family 9 protein [Desulfarculaceae bacterium]